MADKEKKNKYKDRTVPESNTEKLGKFTKSVLSNFKFHKAPDQESFFSRIKPKYVFFILGLICCACIILSLTVENFSKPFKAAAGIIIVPAQEGINNIGLWISDQIDKSNDIEALNEENAQLKEQISELTAENNTLKQYESTIEELETLLELKDTYTDYETIAAQIVSKNSDKWFSTFTINKGSSDGIEVDMNIVAEGGLVGIVTDVGLNYATCRSIIDDDNNVSAMLQGTLDICVVTGSLTLMEDNIVAFSDLSYGSEISVGSAVVTSTVSSKYLPNLLIGYVSSYEADGNDLTISGYITPAVDFEKLTYVLVITQLKETSD